MGNSRNRSQKKKRIPPSKRSKKIQDGRPNYKDRGPSSTKISKYTAIVSGILGNMDTVIKEGTIFMDLSVLFQVFDNILKCPECGGEMSSHIDTKKKNGYSHYIVLQCKSMKCEWKHCFNTSKKQGRSHEVNLRAVLAFREIGRGHSAMTTFSKVMNMPAPPARRIVTKDSERKAFTYCQAAG